MVYALISDIHGNLPALEAVFQDAAEQGADHYAFLGDYCIGLGYPNEVLNRIRTLPSAYVVSGNEDESFRQWREIPEQEWPKGQYEALAWYYGHLSPQNRDYVVDLPEELKILRDDKPPLHLFHKADRYFAETSVTAIKSTVYAQWRDAALFSSDSFPSYNHSLHSGDAPLQKRLDTLEPGVYAFGHNHIQWSYRKGDKLLISTGACGLPLDFDPRAAYVLLSWQKGQWECELRRVHYDWESALEDMAVSQPAQALPVWYGVISKEVKTSREQAIPFIHFADQYAKSIGDDVRPLSRETWYSAYRAWQD